MPLAANFLTLWVMAAVGNVKYSERQVKTPTVLMTHTITMKRDSLMSSGKKNKGHYFEKKPKT